MTAAAHATTCPRCEGSGQRWSRIEERHFTCPACAGHGWYPTAGGPYWFYHPRQKRYNEPGVHADSERIAVLQQWGDAWRLTLFDQRGPMTHYDNATALQLMEELRGFRFSPTNAAARLLDFWATRQAWEDGRKARLKRAYWNLLCYHGARDEVFATTDLPETEQLAALARLKCQVAPNIDLF